MMAAAFAEARRVDRSIASGNVGPLAGVPFTVKDCLWVEGKRATRFRYRGIESFYIPNP